MSKTLKQVDERPRYREAYPQLDIARAKAAFNRGRSICDFMDRFGEPLGVARVDFSGDRCQLEYELRTPYTEPRTDWNDFELSIVTDGMAKHRVTILCPDCKTKRKTLFFKDRWSCGPCLDLAYRSQFIHPLCKKWEKFDKLTNRLKNGKPHYLRNKKYSILLDELETLRQSLYGKERSYASDKYSIFVACTWRTPNQKDELVFPGIKIYAAFIEEGRARRELATLPLFGPNLTHWGADHTLSGDYETDDPDKM